jgi:hypothetical protein
MKKEIRIAAVFLLVLTITGCAETGTSSEVVLEVVGPESSVTLTMDDLQDMPAVEGWCGTISSTGTISTPLKMKGVSLVELMDLVGGLKSDMGINIVAKDGYSITMSYDQTINGNFITYDPGTGVEKKVGDVLTPIVAYERDGEPIPEEEDGPLRIFIISESNNQIVDGHWSVKWVEKLELRPLAEDWVLSLEGTITEDLDRASFESCMAPGCHGATWTDSDGNVWSGVPLYLLAGRVDDGNVHEDRAYNDEYALVGYSLEIFAMDGYNLSLPSGQSNFNEEIILASILNGEPLGEDQFPLRLVGEGLGKNQMASQIAQVVIVPNEGVEVPSSEPRTSEVGGEETLDLTLPEGAVLKVAGKLRNQLVLTQDNLEALGVEEIQVEHPKEGIQTVRGLGLEMLLSLAGMHEGSTLLVITAADGYSVELPLEQIQTCEQCVVVMEEDGSLSTAMDGLDGSYWVKDVVHLWVK